MHNLKLTIAYDGTAYFGWQRTEAGPSIEGVLQKVIEQIIQHPIELQAASRTDARVHAEGQVVNFITHKTLSDLGKFRSSLNDLLPKTIIVLSVEDMPLSFHPTLDCTGKEYRYFVSLGFAQLPHQRLYSWHVPGQVNKNVIHAAIPQFIGSHNFSAFCNTHINRRYTNDVREIQFLAFNEIEVNRYCFQIRGNHFLYKMVRNIVGTLIDIGRGRLNLEALPGILTSGHRAAAGVTAPAHGLFLSKVFY